MNRDDTNAWVILRVVAGLAGFIPAPLAFLILRARGSAVVSWWGAIMVWTPAPVAALCRWCALRVHHTLSRARMVYAVVGGMVLGGVAFVAGFVGSIIYTPQANQGPLLGIFVTGPAGLLVGFWLGAFVGSFGFAPNPLPNNPMAVQ